MLKKMLEQKERLRPEKGFRLVGVDDFEPAGEQLYPISDHATRAEAEAALATWTKSHTGPDAPNTDMAYIYEPATDA